MRQSNGLYKKYYNYVYAEPLAGEIFYVGKGCNNRDTITLNKVKNGKIPNGQNYPLYKRIKDILLENMEPIILRIAEFDNEDDAYNNEVCLINKYKSEGNKLCNITEGGCGSTTNEAKRKWADPITKQKMLNNIKTSFQSKDYRKKRSEIAKANYDKNPGLWMRTRQKIKDLWANPEWRERVLTKRKLAMSTDEFRAKRSKATKIRMQDVDFRAIVRNGYTKYLNDKAKFEESLKKQRLSHNSFEYRQNQSIKTRQGKNKYDLQLGVTYDKKAKKFIAQIRIGNKHKYLGIYNTPEEAKQKYLTAYQLYLKDTYETE